MSVLARRRLPRLAALTLALSFAAVPQAAAHDSEYCEHASPNGRHWNVVYDGYWNEDGTSVDDGRDHHYHAVNHNYRETPDSGPYHHYHRRGHYCGMTSGQWSRSAGVEPPPEPLHSPVFFDFDVPADAPVQVRSGEQVQSVTRMVNGLVTLGKVSISALYLTANPFEPIGARRAAAVPSGACVMGFVKRRGTRKPVVEVAAPELAARLGHAC